MNLQILNNEIHLAFKYDPVEKIHAAKRAGLWWTPKSGSWRGSADFQTVARLAAELPELAEELAPWMPPILDWTPSPYLMAHQVDGARLALEHPRFGFFDDTGTGKTALGIELIKQKGLKTLVVCNLSLIVNAWMWDLNKFGPELQVVNLWDLQRRKARVPDHDVALINYERFRSSWEQFDGLGYKMVLIDESSKVKSHNSQVTKAIVKFCDRIPFVYLFSGTPAPNNEMEYWSQMRIIDRALLGNSFYSFRNKYCYSFGYGGYQWRMKDNMKPEFLEKIATKSRVVRKEDVLDLPERTFNTRTVYLSKPELAAYKGMEANLLAEIGDQEVMAATSAAKVMKLRQGSSGFYYDEDGNPVWAGRSKLEELKDLLEEIGNHQVIIWYQFRAEGDAIEQMLGRCSRVDGTISNQGVKDDAVRDFMAGHRQYLIAHPASLGHGVTLVNCTYAVYFSMSHSYELHYQSQDRIYRAGQKNACTYYNLVADGTVDREILRALQEKEDAAMAVFKYLKNERG